MKLLTIADVALVDSTLPSACKESLDVVMLPRDSTEEERLAVASDADFILVDSITPISDSLLSKMPHLKLVECSGVAYNKVDLKAAAKRGVYVCNGKGVNAKAVAEYNIYMMIGLLRGGFKNDWIARHGNQIARKEEMMLSFCELSDCTVGLVGFGDIGRATATVLQAFGAKTLYYARHNYGTLCHAEYAELPDLLQKSDFLVLCVPVTSETMGMVNLAFLKQMKKSAYLINTARGEIVNQNDLAYALEGDWIAGAGIDVLTPEPFTADNPLLCLSQKASEKVIFSPHIAGVSRGMFLRSHQLLWGNIQAIQNGDRPKNVVNGL